MCIYIYIYIYIYVYIYIYIYIYTCTGRDGSSCSGQKTLASFAGAGVQPTIMCGLHYLFGNLRFRNALKSNDCPIPMFSACLCSNLILKCRLLKCLLAHPMKQN